MSDHVKTPCRKCGAKSGAPCRSANGKTARPHSIRRHDSVLQEALGRVPGAFVGVQPATYSEDKAAWGTVTGWAFTCPDCLFTSHIYQKKSTCELIESEHKCIGKATA